MVFLWFGYKAIVLTGCFDVAVKSPYMWPWKVGVIKRCISQTDKRLPFLIIVVQTLLLINESVKWNLNNFTCIVILDAGKGNFRIHLWCQNTVLEKNYSIALRRQHVIMTMWHLKLLNPVLEFLLGEDWTVHKTGHSLGNLTVRTMQRKFWKLIKKETNIWNLM